jgi:hypothetical protein
MALASTTRTRLPASRPGRAMVALLLPLATALAVAAYYVVRPDGRWSENDTVVLSDAIAWMVRSQQLIPTPGFVYPHGYAFQVVATFVLAYTGLHISTFQQLVAPLLSALLIAPLAVGAYRELTGGLRAGVLATMLLLVAPEFLFVTLRGSHEKVSRALMLLALWLIARGLRLATDRRQYAVHVVLFCAATYGVIAGNTLFATSFVLAFAAAIPVSWLLSRWWDAPARHMADMIALNLVLPTVCVVGLNVLFNNVIYPPASSDINVYQEILDKVTHLVHQTQQGEQPAGAPYQVVQASWISPTAYFAVSLGDWLLIGSSLAYWAWDGWHWIVRRRDPPSQAAWLLWVLYAAFALQGAAAIVSDFSGALAQNLQYRAFQSFTLVAVALLARGLLGTLASGPGWVRYGVAALVAALACLGALKSSNEPLLSNKWMFYTQPEVQALRWADANARGASIWTEVDERLTAGYQLGVTMDIPPLERNPNGNQVGDYILPPGDRDFVVSDVTRVRAQRLGYTLLPPTVQLRTYDNGSTQIYSQLRQSPYER